MNDRELLNLAAKAVGGKLISESRFGDLYDICGHLIFWDPLADDGHALRLAVVLGVKVRWHAVLNQALAWPASVTETLEVHENGEDHGGDKFSATRRAIVRAAAEIAKNLKE